MWTKKSYDALFTWAEGKKDEAIAVLAADGLTGQIATLNESKNLGEWYALVKEAREAIGSAVVSASAGQAAAQLGRLGGSVKSDAKAAAARANGLKGGRPKKEK